MSASKAVENRMKRNKSLPMSPVIIWRSSTLPETVEIPDEANTV